MNKNAKARWEEFSCPFFAATCRRILSDYLEQQGLFERKLTPAGEVVYGSINVFLEIGYEPETYPNYSPTIVLGIGPEKYDEGGRPSGVPFWYVIPNNLPERRYTFWKFTTQTDLESVLARIKDAILEPHARPLWLNLERLKKRIAEFRAEY
jgi:hypothetical protein